MSASGQPLRVGKLIVPALIIALSGARAQTVSQAARAPIDVVRGETAAALQRLIAGYKLGNPDSMAAVYAENARMEVSRDRVTWRGRASIRADFLSQTRLTRYDAIVATQEEFYLCGDRAFEFGLWNMVTAAKATDSPSSAKQRYGFVWERQPNGDWLIQRSVRFGVPAAVTLVKQAPLNLAPAAPDATVAVRTATDLTLKQWSSGLTNANAARFASTYTLDGSFEGANTSWRTRGAIENGGIASFAKYAWDTVDFGVEEFYACGDVAFEYAMETQTQLTKATNASSVDAYTFGLVWKKQGDGTWLIYRSWGLKEPAGTRPGR